MKKYNKEYQHSIVSHHIIHNQMKDLLLLLLLASQSLAGTVKLANRASLGPIGTSNPNVLTGGTVQTDAPPLSSFFKDLKGPVSLSIYALRLTLVC
jgi:hypothetical protein